VVGWGVLGLLTVAGLVVVQVATSGTTLAAAAFSVAGVGCATAAWLGDRRRPQNRRSSGALIPIAITCLVLGDVLRLLIAQVTGSIPTASPADVLAVAGLVTLGAMGLSGRVGGRSRRGARLYSVLDAIAALSVALLLMVTSGVVDDLTAQGVSATSRFSLLLLPVLDAVLVGLLAWRLVLHGRLRPVAVLLLFAVGCWLAADVARLLLTAGHDAPAWLIGGRIIGLALLAIAPWVPQSHPEDPAARRGAGHGPWRMFLNVAPFAAPALVEVVAWEKGTDVNPLPGLVVWSVLLVVTTVRTGLVAVDGQRAWAVVRSQARRSEALAVNSSDAVAVVDERGRLTAESSSLARSFGIPAPAGTELAELVARAGGDPASARLLLTRSASRPGVPVGLELAGRRPDGTAFWLGGRAVNLLDDFDVAGIVVSLHDITDRKLAELELAHQAFYDDLTGLANRALFLEHTEQALRRAGRSGSPPIVLCLDLDGFKDVNDSVGHLAGDELLRVVAGRLRGVVRSADTVARLGGDEFAVLVDDTTAGLPEAAELAQRLLEVIAEPVDLGGHAVTVAASIGIVVGDPGATPLGLFRDADIAMYRAKAAGRAQWVVFDLDMRTAALERIELERELAGALTAGQLRLTYQPVVDLQTEQVVGFEALLRWQHPTLGAVGPDRFVPVAEGSGEIVPIGRWVLAEATRTAARWQRAHPTRPLTMAVNVSARQLVGGMLLQHVAEALSESGIVPSSLVLEVTETALVTDAAAVAERLAELRALGVRLALDDFGTGYSSLSYLRQFDVDVLKIDRSFVSLLDGSPDDAAIVHGLVQLGRTLRLEVVAEGVETTGQRDRLRAERCDLAQGYLFAGPLEVADAELLLLGTAVADPAAQP
jgi:diguanylate cyclase (GGDEF)-like protein/PAS domain S-box-containing protein